MIRSSAQINGNILKDISAKFFFHSQFIVEDGAAIFVQRLSAVSIDEQGGKLKRRGAEAEFSFKHTGIKR